MHSHTVVKNTYYFWSCKIENDPWKHVLWKIKNPYQIKIISNLFYFFLLSSFVFIISLFFFIVCLIFFYNWLVLQYKKKESKPSTWSRYRLQERERMSKARIESVDWLLDLRDRGGCRSKLSHGWLLPLAQLIIFANVSEPSFVCTEL